MAELVDALDSGSSQGNLVDVRVILAAKISLVIKNTPPYTPVLLTPLGGTHEISILFNAFK